MSVRDTIATDLVISPFGADAADMVEVARCADDSGFDGIWTFDHFSGSMLDRPWSRETFSLLGAFATSTSRVTVGPLVANVMNRHPSLLASAASTLSSLSGGRAVLGLGSGAAPGSRFAGEHTALDRRLDGAAGRRRRLIEGIAVIRLIWAGGGDYEGEFYTLHGLDGVVAPDEGVPIIVGASSRSTTELACAHADGLNVLVGARVRDHVELATSLTEGRPFEISVFDELDLVHPLGGEVERWVDLGVARRTMTVAPPFDIGAIERIGNRL